MAVQIQLRRGTAAQWTSANPTLASGEVGFETDTNKEKIGDGTTAWNSLAYFGGGSPGGSPGQIQYNNSGAFGGDANLTFSGSTTTAANLIISNLTASLAVFSSSTKQLVSNPITGTGSVVMNSSPILTSPSLITPALGSPTSGNMAATTNIPVANATGTLAVGNGGTGLQTIPAGNVVIGNGTSALYGVAPGTAGNVLTSTGSAWVSNAAVTGGGSPGGANTNIQFNSSSTFGGSANLTWDGANVQIGSAGALRFADSDSSNYASFQSPATLAANTAYTLPTALPAVSGYVLSCTTGGVMSWIAAPGSPTAPSTVEYLVVAGGGGGGTIGGGGGAGGLLTNAAYVIATATSYTITVGAFGAGANSSGFNDGTSGSPSVFGTGAVTNSAATSGTITSLGGGFGAGNVTGGTGGSGGGAPSQGSAGFPGSGTTGQGNAGGAGVATPPYPSGGGGGAGGAGGAGAVATSGGGGLGTSSSITGTATTYAGGGSGGARTPGGAVTAPSSPTSGGTGGQGAAGGAGVTNTGGGGGGGGYDGSSFYAAGAGGSGVVIIAFPNTSSVPTISGGLVYDQPTRSGYRVYRFTSGTGTISWT